MKINDYTQLNTDLLRLNLDFQLNGLGIKTKWLAIVPDIEVWQYPKHMHSTVEFHIIVKGKCHVSIGNRNFIVNAGELYIVPPRVYHAQQSDRHDPAIEYGLNCELTFDPMYPEWEPFVKQLDDTRVPVVPDQFGAADSFEQIINEVLKRQTGYHVAIKFLVLMVITNSIRAIMDYKKINLNTNQIVNERDVNQIRMMRINEFLDDNLATYLTLKDLAGFIHLSEKQCNRIVKQETKMSFHKYQQIFKIKIAQEMLRDSTNPKVTEIATNLGFTDERHFRRVFKEITGVSPLYYLRDFHN